MDAARVAPDRLGRRGHRPHCGLAPGPSRRGIVTGVGTRAGPDDGDVAGYLRALSARRVWTDRPSGPVFSRRVPRRVPVGTATFVPAVGAGARVLIGVLSGAWALTYVAFWVWWFDPAHRVGWVAFAVNTALLGYVATLPIYYLLTVNRLRRVSPSLAIPYLRVALVVTKTPGEPWPVVRTTLEAMLVQRYPHDYHVWLCDEDPIDETTVWCAERGVRVSTRRGIAAYQRAVWPRRRRCKEGNLAFFYDRVGYRDYDVVAQLDSDHRPAPTYLAEMVRAFADPAIGYVAAPSVCDANRRTSWAVRGRLFQEATFHGPHQLGHNGGLAPIGIGSHYAVRTRALASIGGIGPELAEDFTTSYLMNVAGWHGAFAIDAQASGEGPTTFAAMFDTTTWGWIHILVGALLLAAGFGLFTGATWARIVAIIAASLSIIANFLWLPYYPAWSILLIALAIVVIWAIATWDSSRA
ncbi:MAG TPA: glycosyltransferase [Aldersonia sp.]